MSILIKIKDLLLTIISMPAYLLCVIGILIIFIVELGKTDSGMVREFYKQYKEALNNKKI